MSVTIVSPPRTPAQPATENATAGGENAAGDDFANLLQDQLALGTAAPAALAITATVPTQQAKTDDDASAGAGDQGSDASSLLATLALLTPPVNPQSATPASGGEQADSAAASALPGASPFDKAALATEQSDALKAARQVTNAAEAGEPTSAGTATAKFAVTPVTAEDIGSAKKDTTAIESRDVATINHNVHSHSGKPLENSTSLSVSTPVRDQQWASDFAQKVVWLASGDKQSAQLTLNPEQMGPIEISLDMDHGNASVSFSSANAEVRNAIEAALPRLREMFASAGVELGQTNVGAESFRQQGGNGGSNPSSSRATVDNAILAAETAVPLQSRGLSAQRGNALVDLFA